MIAARCKSVPSTMHTVGLNTGSCLPGPVCHRRLLRLTRKIFHPLIAIHARAGSLFEHADPRVLRIRECTEVMTPSSVSILVLNTGNANGRSITRNVRTGDKHSNGFMTIGYNILPHRLTTSLLFKRRGNTFANTSATGGKCFSVTGNNALFLSRVNAVPVSVRSVLLEILRRGACVPVNDSERQVTSIEVITTAGRGLRQTVGRNQFQRSLCRHLTRLRVEVPSLTRYTSSVLPLTRFFHRQFSGRLGGRAGNFSGSTVCHLHSCH